MPRFQILRDISLGKFSEEVTYNDLASASSRSKTDPCFRAVIKELLDNEALSYIKTVGKTIIFRIDVKKVDDIFMKTEEFLFVDEWMKKNKRVVYIG